MMCSDEAWLLVISVVMLAMIFGLVIGKGLK
jgi:hypothetical protein